MMFNGIEIIIGSLGALIGIGGGYLILSPPFSRASGISRNPVPLKSKRQHPKNSHFHALDYVGKA